jgi:peptidoglycan-N-acetylglucosamine deacetylase
VPPACGKHSRRPAARGVRHRCTRNHRSAGTPDSQFRVVTGLTGTGTVSVGSADFPGYYLRHKNFEVWLEKNDGTSTFASDASFHRRAGLADSAGISYESSNYAGRHLRHYDYLLSVQTPSTTTDKSLVDVMSAPRAGCRQRGSGTASRLYIGRIRSMYSLGMPNLTRKMKNTGAWLRPAAISAAAACLTVTLTGCGGPDTTHPSAARAHPAATTHAARFGAVDCREAKCIALTFDAGPSENSARLLDILKEKQVPATFFLLGARHIEKYPELVRRMAAEGHEVASHTWDHKILTQITPAEIREELQRPNDAIERLTGRRPTLMRPPQGRTNETVHKISRELGLAEVLWSVTAKDYTTTDSALIQRRVLAQADRDGIILLHDIYDGTVPAVPGIIDALKERGYVFVTVPQLLAPGEAQPGRVYR